MIYNPDAYVLCEITASDTAQNVTVGITNPVRLCEKTKPHPGNRAEFFLLASLGFGWLPNGQIETLQLDVL
jgi:hypothetical protein